MILEWVLTSVWCAGGVMVGVWSTRGHGSRGAGDASPAAPAYRPSWDPSPGSLRRLPGPLVYVVREWDGDMPQPFVKVGWTGVTEPGAVARRIGDWETGSRFPLRVEAVVPSAPQSLERALHRALGDSRTSKKREWFEAQRGDTVFREIVEATCALHKPTKEEVEV